MNNVSDRIRYVMLQESLTQKDLADLLGTSQQVVYNWLVRNAISKEKAFSLSNKLGYNMSWILSGEGDPKDSSFIPNGENQSNNCISVPLIDINPSTGDIEHISNYQLPFSRDELRKININVTDLGAIKAIGDSMQPQFKDGDVVSFNKTDNRVRDGKIYVIKTGNIPAIKILTQNHDGSITIKSRNQDYKDEIISKDDIGNGALTIIGRVWWVSSLI